jgi:hypothetical protein
MRPGRKTKTNFPKSQKNFEARKKFHPRRTIRINRFSGREAVPRRDAVRSLRCVYCKGCLCCFITNLLTFARCAICPRCLRPRDMSEALLGLRVLRWLVRWRCLRYPLRWLARCYELRREIVQQPHEPLFVTQLKPCSTTFQELLRHSCTRRNANWSINMCLSPVRGGVKEHIALTELSKIEYAHKCRGARGLPLFSVLLTYSLLIMICPLLPRHKKSVSVNMTVSLDDFTCGGSLLMGSESKCYRM